MKLSRCVTVLTAVVIGLFSSWNVAGQETTPGSSEDGIQDSTVEVSADSISESKGIESSGADRAFAPPEGLESETTAVNEPASLNEPDSNITIAVGIEPADTQRTPIYSRTDIVQHVEGEANSARWYLTFFTSIVLFLTFLVAFITYRQKTKPIIQFSLIPDPLDGIPTGLHIRPLLHNRSDTDALGIVIIEFVLFDRTRIQFKPANSAYGGGWIWNLQARVEISGNTNLTKVIQKFESDPKLKAKYNTEGCKCPLVSIECVVYTVRWRNWRNSLLRFIVSRYPIVYRTPTYKWELVNDQRMRFTSEYRWTPVDFYKWVFKPDHESLPTPKKPNIKVFRRALMTGPWK